MIEGLQIPIPQRMVLLRIALCVSLILSFLMSFHLWGGARMFPVAPLLDLGIRPPYDLFLPFLSVIFLAGSMLLRYQRFCLLLALSINVLMVIGDLNRLQPWFYMYNAMLFVFVLYNGRVDDPNKYTAYFTVLQIMAASVYFFCGWNQLNPAFAEKEFPELISPLKAMLSERQFDLFVRPGKIVPFVLMFIGAGLLVPAVRYLAISFGVILHVFLILFLFPSSRNSNYALWLSNVCFLLILFLLFSGKTKQRYFSPSFLFQTPVFYVAVIVFMIMPFLNVSGNWPDFLSFNFRGGNNKMPEISLSPQACSRLPSYEKSFCLTENGKCIVHFEDWCRDELHADCNPSDLVFNSICRSLADRCCNGDVKEIELNRDTPGGQLLKR